MKRVAIYLRVSTSKQDTDNQRRELEAVAERSGWKVVKVYEDAGISGAKGRDQRPGLDAMMKAVNAKEFDMVASWSVDRLGRSLTDLFSILQGLHNIDILRPLLPDKYSPLQPNGNGLQTPSIDHLFDRGFTGFENNGALIISTSRASSLTSKDGYRHHKGRQCGRAFTSGQKQFLDFHRNAVLLQSIRG